MLTSEILRDVLHDQLRAARRYGHTHDQFKTVSAPETYREIEGVVFRFAAYSFEDVDCELCRIENEINRLDEADGHDWREQLDEQIDAMMQTRERKAGGAIY